MAPNEEYIFRHLKIVQQRLSKTSSAEDFHSSSADFDILFESGSNQEGSEDLNDEKKQKESLKEEETQNPRKQHVFESQKTGTKHSKTLVKNKSSEDPKEEGGTNETGTNNKVRGKAAVINKVSVSTDSPKHAQNAQHKNRRQTVFSDDLDEVSRS